MKSSLFSLLVSTAALAAPALASAQISASFDFDSITAGSEANLLSTPEISFYGARWVPFTDAFGDPIAGTEHWEADHSVSAVPVTVVEPFDGMPISGPNALDGYFGPIFVQFDQAYRLDAFSVTLDNDPFGQLLDIAFVDSSSVLAALTIDQTVPGLIATWSTVDGLTGIVLPGGAAYDNLTMTLTPIPEPSTYGMVAAGLALAGVAWRRRRR